MDAEPVRQCSDAELLAIVRLADLFEQFHP
jgi:hypothetical protein